MIDFEKFTLDNGLKVIVHQDKSTPIAAVNLLYDVGARDEHPERTGFAHLFEHLMFGGSVNIPNFDIPLERVGGNNNAFTSNDMTNYYITLPVANIETAFWLESDRMLSLAFTEKSLEVQRNVVIEEFKQNYLNQPYGDVWLLLRPLAYKKHPYRWSTIGMKVEHIAEASMQEVKDFFYRYYRPDNAILVVAGDVTVEQVKGLTEKWFGDISPGEKEKRERPVEPRQNEARYLTVERDVPQDAIYKVWHMPARSEKDYYAFDLISDILSRGKSSRLYRKLVKKQNLFSDLDAYITGDSDPGLFVITGNLSEGVSMQIAEHAILKEIELLQEEKVEEKELKKVKNKVEASISFSEMNVLHKAMGLAMAELYEDAELVNSEIERYRKVSEEQIKRVASEYLIPANSSTLYYKAKNG